MKISSEPNVRSVRLQLHPTTSNFVNYLSSPAQLEQFFTTSEVQPNEVLSAFEAAIEKDETAGRKLTEVQQLSLLMNDEIEIRLPRNGKAMSFTVRVKDLSVVESFLLPYIATLQRTYFDSWIANFEAAESRLMRSHQAESTQISDLPYSELIELKTIENLLDGSTLLATYQSKKTLHLSPVKIAILSMIAGLIASLFAFFGLKYKSIIVQRIFAD